MKKNYLYWILAVVVTLTAVIYQRKTGPTYPLRSEVGNGTEIFAFKLPRSHGGTTDCPVILPIPDTSLTAVLQFKRYPTSEEYKSIPFTRTGDSLIAKLPNQPPAGKLEYHIQFFQKGNMVAHSKNEAVIIRFKGEVPAGVLIPHVVFMFFAMFFSTLAGVMALGKKASYKFYTGLTFLLLLIGGMILGPIVQKFAFGAYWTGFPFGYDLTDNKTLIGFLFWLTAWIGNRKKERPWLSILAALVLLMVYSIPHSMRGSELNYESGQVTTGFILIFPGLF